MDNNNESQIESGEKPPEAFAGSVVNDAEFLPFCTFPVIFPDGSTSGTSTGNNYQSFAVDELHKTSDDSSSDSDNDFGSAAVLVPSGKCHMCIVLCLGIYRYNIFTVENMIVFLA